MAEKTSLADLGPRTSLADLGPSAGGGLSDLGPSGLQDSLADLGPEAEEKKPSLLDRILNLPGIRPMPVAMEAKQRVEQAAREAFLPAEQAISKVLPSPAPTGNAILDTWNSSIRFAVRSMIPIPEPETAAMAAGVLTPVSELDYVGYILPGIFPAVRAMQSARMASVARATGKAAPAAESVLDASDKLEKLRLAAVAKMPKPIIEIIPSGRPAREVLVETLAARQRATAIPVIGTQTTARAIGLPIPDAIKAAKEGKTLGLRSGQQVMRWMAEEALDGRISLDSFGDAVGLAVKRGVKPAEIVENFLAAGSAHGRGLSNLSRMERALSDIFKTEPEALLLLKNLPEDSSSVWTRLADGIKYLESTRLGLMVSQPATAIRNLVSQGGTYSLGAMEHVMSAAEGFLTGKVSAMQAADIAMADVLAAVGRMSKSNRARVESIIETFSNPKNVSGETFAAMSKMLKAPATELAVDKWLVRKLNTINNFQETQFRKMAFDARLRQLAASNGIDIIKDASKITEEMVRKAALHALQMTYAADPTSRIGRWILKGYDIIPFSRAIGPAFPKFMLNSMRVLYDFSPLPLMPGMGTYAKMASKDPVVAFRAINRAAIGTGLIASGFAADQMGMTGERWYQAKGEDGKLYDVRPYAPFAAHWFIGRLISRTMQMGPDALLQLSKEDWTQVMISMRRTDLTGIPLLDALEQSDIHAGYERVRDSVSRLVGNYVGTFFTPFRAFGDVTAQFSEAENVPRTGRERPLTGLAMLSIPFLRQRLPERPSAFREKAFRPENPLMRQITPWRFFTRETGVETEAARLGIKRQQIYPRTGSPTFDNIIVSKMGPIAARSLADMMSSPGYQDANFRQQRIFFGDAISEVRKAGKAIASGERPDLLLEELQKKLDGRLKRLGLELE